ncbi:MAG: hypothetical protein V3V49_06890 [Candidatus Krumholzibacteria bacterium]
MKKVILLTTVMLFGASLAFGQVGFLGTYADPGGLECNVDDAVAGLLNVFIVSTHSIAAAVAFKAETPLCMSTTGASFLADTKPFPVTVGNSQTGVSVAYGACLGPDATNVLIIAYFASGTTPLCCFFPITGDPAQPGGEIIVTDCAFDDNIGVGVIHTVNGTPENCACTPPSPPVPVEESTWGKVKSLYVE